jgi:DNA-binding transcriptional LysR family regulator
MDRLSNIEAFVAVIESGSFSAAAERLGIARSMVSRRVGALEKGLGVQLLQRTTRSLSLTGPGRQFFERAVRVLADLDEAEQSVAESAVALRGRIRLAAPLSFGLHHLVGALNDFLLAHPEVELDLDLNDREVSLVEEGFDLAVRIGTLRDSTLLARRIGTARFVTCASPDYLARHGEPRSPAELADHTGLHYANLPPRQAWQFGEDHAAAQATLPRLRVRANNGDALAAAAAAGLGLITSPTFIAWERLRDGELVPVLEGFPRQPVGIHAVYPPGRLMPRRVQVLSEHLASRFGDLPYWDLALGIGLPGPGDGRRPGKGAP